MMEVNLLSDTATKPTKAMLEAMMQAEVGDDVFRGDPTINRLQARVASMFGHEASLFCPSGTMTNQIALQVHTGDLEEVICDKDSHIFQYETGGYAYNGRLAIHLLDGEYGKITASQLQKAVRPGHDWLPKSSLVSLENSCNKGGGSYYTLDEIDAIKKVCDANHLKFHLDGARIFNVLVETGDEYNAWGQRFDTLSICLSKGLGAPVGSLLIGNQEIINQARRYRKVMGGGMRQAGILAAAGLYALDHHIDRLKVDNDRAKSIGNVLRKCSFIKEVNPVHTNIVIAQLDDHCSADDLVAKLEAYGIMSAALGDNTIRLVTHLDINEEMMDYTLETLTKVNL